MRLYLPPEVEGTVKNPQVELLITKGEKKALRGCEDGFNCMAIGGLWNWLEEGKPVADLDRIAQVDRPVTLVPDPDVWSRPTSYLWRSVLWD